VKRVLTIVAQVAGPVIVLGVAWIGLAELMTRGWRLR
jgi:hypothetical protein